ncbi:pH-response regulator protein palA/RIM20-like [Arachis stenosperma]|uniref:pH-response regulator protein palA/RIM20-like n=1 Tax=Arachis stenosperma TaxID=217475 RepID=UPI0025AB8D9F|nr:pH-response regulator protein palA/RIM20-like [Arachis stenosperma]
MNNDDRVLSAPLKKTDPVELYQPLRKLVASKYSEGDAQKVESVLQTLNKCRRDMVEPRADLSLPMQRDCLLHYFKCLSMVAKLFTSLSSDADPILFVWYDAFNPDHQDGVSSQRSAIQLEKAAVVFNLGAIYSQIAASCDRTTALGRHLAMEAFKVAANFFLQLWQVFAKDVVATLDLTLVFAEFLHLLFSAQASEFELREELNNNDASYALQQHRCALLFRSVYDLYHRAYELIPTDSAARKHVDSFDQTWVTHLYQKATFFEAEARQRQSSILPKSERPPEFKSVTSCALDHDAECVPEILVRRICCGSSSVRKLLHEERKQTYIDLNLSEYNPFKMMKYGKLVAYPWDMPPPYPTDSAILSSSLSSLSSDILAFIPLKKSEPLNLYESLRSYFVLKYSESVAERVDGLLEMLHKLRNEMLRDDLSPPLRRDCLMRYYKCLCMIEPVFPMNASPNPPIFVWYNAINPQQHSSQHNIHLEKASVLFNLAAICTHIALSCDLTTVQGRRLAMDAKKEASHWFYLMSTFESRKASGTIDVSRHYFHVLDFHFHHLELMFRVPQPDEPSLSGYPVSAYYPSTSGPPLAYDPSSDVTQQFVLGYSNAHSRLQGVCRAAPCLDLLSEVSPVKIKDGNLVANAATLEGTKFGIGEHELAGDTTTVALP